MASLKEVRGRITSVKSTQQITRAMKMVAAAKLRRAQDATERMRPYAEKLNGILTNLTASTDGTVESRFQRETDEIKNVLIVVVTSDKGLCGAFNSNVHKKAIALIKKKYQAQNEAGNLEILGIGKRGAEFFQRKNYQVNHDYRDLFLKLSFEKVSEAADYAMEGFVSGKFDAVEIVYNEFKNVATQNVVAEPFLPIVEKEEEEKEVSQTTDYIFEPSQEEIIRFLIPKSLKIQFYKAVLESNASEHGARMTAMDKATENAGDLLKDLKLVYNRTRQAAITTEILEIVSGAEALAAG
jgi:F-type H+-transporting ATPase subunit gamma